MYFATAVCQRSPPSATSKMLNFDDSEDEYGHSMAEATDCPVQKQSTCRRSVLRTPSSNVHLWDSGIGSPTPGSSPKTFAVRTVSRGQSRTNGRRLDGLSPIPFRTSCDESDADEPPTGVTVPPDTPPHRRMRSLRLYDTPHTPKSLLEKSQHQRQFGRNAGHFSMLTATPMFSDGGSPLKESCSKSSANKSRRSLDPYGPQANINPFTACRKRVRQELDGYVK